MARKSSYRALTPDEITALQGQGCSASNWKKVTVADGFDTACVSGVQFAGKVKIAKQSGMVATASGLDKPSGIYNATLIDCNVGENVRIANIGVHIANYDIGENVCIENVGTMQTNPAATFGNGVQINVLNEAGGREVTLFDQLSAQFAYLLCLHRYRPELIEKLQAIAADYVASVKSDRGRVGAGACISSTTEIVDVNVGAYAKINGASSLINGTILSDEDAPSAVGAAVVARDFIIAESSTVDSGAMLDGVYAGQGCQIGKQFSADSSVFFANCEAFGGEATSVFAGPYTVTHHKSTLLIAGLFSFFNAGSGTNQSNHMYRLGPVHEGRLERGSKTGSSAYLMWPCRVGPFSIVLGKHTSRFDTSDFPFSRIKATPAGKCQMLPGVNLATVGTVRDGAKWPQRDRRTGTVNRDAISFAVLSPFTAGKMLTADATLKHLRDSDDSTGDQITIGEVLVKRSMLKAGRDFYQTGIQMYLLENIFQRIEKAVEAGETTKKTFAVAPGAVFSEQWVDIAGLLMPADRLMDLENAIEAGDIASTDAFAAEIDKICNFYAADEWAWVKMAYMQVFGADLDFATGDDLVAICRDYQKTKAKFQKLVAADAAKEFGELSRCGFGQDGGAEDVETDFHEVRGVYEDNAFVADIIQQMSELETRVTRVVEAIK